MDTPNWSLDILIPNNPDTKKFFKRYARFLFNDMAWEIQVVDSISIEGILQITALEYYKDADKDKPDEALADAFIIKPAREEKSGELDFNDESAGTQNLFLFSPLLLKAF